MSAEFPLFLVRHGEAAAHWGESTDPGLSPLGREQALATAQRLAENGSAQTAALLSSPLARARETAAPFAAQRRETVDIGLAFREIPAPVALAQRRDWLRAFMDQRWDEQTDPGVLAWREALLQAVSGLTGPTVVFTHFLVINTLVAHAQGRPETLMFWPDNGSVTQLYVGQGGSLRVGCLGHTMDTVIN